MRGVSDEEFIDAWKRSGNSPQGTSEILGVDIRNVYRRRSLIADKGIILTTDNIERNNNRKSRWATDNGRSYKRQNDTLIQDGTVIVFSDAHFWGSLAQSVASMALVELIRELKPKIIVANGDIFDGASISRHPPLGWTTLPTVREELEVCLDRMNEIETQCKTKPEFFWNVGNHDQRFDRFLCSNAAEFRDLVPRLEDQFPAWNFAWSLLINQGCMVKHRYHNGVHATYNNTMKGGVTMVTGHLHRLAVTPWADYNGQRWGVDTGTLAEPHGPQMDYAENNPSPHQSGFAVLTYRNGVLLPPELCTVIDDVAYFRGKVVLDAN